LTETEALVCRWESGEAAVGGAASGLGVRGWGEGDGLGGGVFAATGGCGLCGEIQLDLCFGHRLGLGLMFKLDL